MLQEDDKQLLIVSLFAYLLAGLMFGIGLMINSIFVLILFYLIALILFLSGMLALYKAYTKNKYKKLYLYLDFIGLMLTALITVAFINSL